MNVLFLSAVFLFTTLLMTFDIKSVNAINGNNYPIIFVHGIYGWTKDEIQSQSYWGGSTDIIGDLNSYGYTAMDVSIGTFSSNWDRACELYYYIKGGTVDYGAAHAAKYGHERFGETFPGIYPEWDEVSKIHLVGHNFGGQTIRLLVELLKNGSKEEQDYSKSNGSLEISPLFQGGKDWVLSITTLGTPLNGSTFANYCSTNNRTNLFINLGKFANLYNSNPKFDFNLEQWGLKRGSNESMDHYYFRVQESDFWKSEDNCLGDLTTSGAENFNNSTEIFPDIYYFSYSANDSHKNIFTGHYFTTSNFFTLSSKITGGYTQNNTLPSGDKAWWPNDGAVSVISEQYPFNEPHVTYYGYAQRGIWNVNETIKGWSQDDFVGLGSRRDTTKLHNLYYNIAVILNKLPK